MQVIHCRNVNEALPLGIRLLRDTGEQRDSCNGPVLAARGPVTTQYARSGERVLFDGIRDANPFFHLFESLWMLAGRNDTDYVAQFAKNMRLYSDDGATLWGAYGWRWRSFFEQDQIQWAIDRLKKDPTDRRVVVQMWSVDDQTVADNGGKDVPCSIAIHFAVRKGMLEMTVFNRSNDIVWGTYGANAVHMSILQEYVAAALGRVVGYYWQVSDDFHGYLSTLEPLGHLYDNPILEDMYDRGEVETTPLFTDPDRLETWNQDLLMLLEEPTAVGFRNSFFRKTATPMMCAHRAFKGGDLNGAMEILQQMPEKSDWRLAAEQWVARRSARRAAQEAAE